MRVDQVISLGWWCQVAHQMERRGLRTSGYPFDWVFSPGLEVVSEIVRDEFRRFLDDLEDLGPEHELSGRVANPHYKGLRFRHDNPLAEPEVAAKYRRRASRFVDAVKSDRRLLFIRMTPGPPEWDAVAGFDQAVRSLNPGARYCLLLVEAGHQARPSFHESPHPDVRAVAMPPGPGGDQGWKGNDAAWDEVLAEFST